MSRRRRTKRRDVAQSNPVQTSPGQGGRTGKVKMLHGMTYLLPTYLPTYLAR
jgi:hypothetical protein